MITPTFIALWFMFSSLVFAFFAVLHRHFYGGEQADRDDNALMILMAQGLGAALAYAIH